MGMINSVIKNTNDNTLSCDAFTPDWNNIYVIANCASSLASICLNTHQKNTTSLTMTQCILDITSQCTLVQLILSRIVTLVLVMCKNAYFHYLQPKYFCIR